MDSFIIRTRSNPKSSRNLQKNASEITNRMVKGDYQERRLGLK